jgi:hypothetical protein
MRKKPSDAHALEALRNLARYKTHGGYVWADCDIWGNE